MPNGRTDNEVKQARIQMPICTTGALNAASTLQDINQIMAKVILRPSNKERPIFQVIHSYVFGSRKGSHQLHDFRRLLLLAPSSSRFRPWIFLQRHHRKEELEGAT